MGGGDRLGKNAELSIPDFAGEPYFLGNLQKCFFSMRALFPFIFPEILVSHAPLKFSSDTEMRRFWRFQTVSYHGEAVTAQPLWITGKDCG